MTSSSSQHVVFEYQKRRFDGGTERELIEQIELQNIIVNQQRIDIDWQHAYQSLNYRIDPAGLQMPYPAPPHPPCYTQQEEVAEETSDKCVSLGSKVYRAFAQPVVELMLGVSGIVVAGIISLPMNRNVENMDSNRRLLIKRSVNVIRKSVVDIITSPMKMAALLTH